MKYFKLIIFNIFVLIIFLIIIDPLFVINDNSGEKRSLLLREISPNANYSLIPGDNYLANTDGLEKKVFSVKTDLNGFIISPRPYYIDTSKTDIIFFGGSTTACLFVDDYKRFPVLVQDTLVKKDSNINLNVKNAGMSGNNTLHSVLNLIGKGLPQRPKIVVLMEDINDLSLLSKTGDYWISPPSKSIIQNDIKVSTSIKDRGTKFLKATKDYLFPNLYNKIYYIIKSAFRKKKLENKQYLEEDEFQNFRELPVPDFEYIKKQFKIMLKTFIKVAKMQNIEVVLMTQFNRLIPQDNFVKSEYNRHSNKIDYETFCKLYIEFNQIIRDLSVEENVPLIDLDKSIPKSKKYIFDAVHLNNTGSEFAAKLISQKIVESFPNYFQFKK